MNQAQGDLFRAFRQRISEGECDHSETAQSIFASRYASQDFFAREAKSLMKKKPVLLASTASIKKPGQFLTTELLQRKIVIVRQKDGSVRGFLNRCSHRNASLVQKKSGECGSFSCPYHQWVYGIDGQLNSIPGGKFFKDMEKSQLSLQEFPVYEQAGLIFAQPWLQKPKNQEVNAIHATFREFLGPLINEFEMYDLKNCDLMKKETVVLKANWKLLVEAFLEAYHIRTVHRRSIAPSVYANCFFQEQKQLHSRGVYPLQKIKAVDWNCNREIRRAMSLVYHFFPFAIIGVQPYHLVMALFRPLNPNESQLDLSFYALDDEEKGKAIQEIELIRHVLNEDFEIAQDIQTHFNDQDSLQKIYFGGLEDLLKNFHRHIDQYIV